MGAAALAAITRPWQEWQPTLDPDTGLAFREPEVLRSEGGVLEVTLRAAPGAHEVAGRRATTLGYNGRLPGPTLAVRAGDVLRVRLVNDLDEVLNLHVHGLHVSPEDNGDNVFVEVGPGESFDYEYRLPEDHPPGVFWYHPHHHGTIADQIYGGFHGAILVEDPEALDVTAERLLVVSDLSLDGDGRILWPAPMEQMAGRKGRLVLVNGQVVPHLTARSGDRERWRIATACTSRFLSLRLDGHRLHLLGKDGGRFSVPVPTEQLVLAPGNRADLPMQLLEEHGQGGRRAHGGVDDPQRQPARTDVLVMHVIFPWTFRQAPVCGFPFTQMRPERQDNRGEPYIAELDYLKIKGAAARRPRAVLGPSSGRPRAVLGPSSGRPRLERSGTKGLSPPGPPDPEQPRRPSAASPAVEAPRSDLA